MGFPVFFLYVLELYVLIQGVLLLEVFFFFFPDFSVIDFWNLIAY